MSMRLAVLSDLHDNVADWDIIAKMLAAGNIAILINCGDTAAPAMLKHMSQSFSGTIHTVFGNVADRQRETRLVESLPNVVHHGDQGAVELEGRKLGFCHFPEVAEAMSATDEFDLVCHGHTHLQRWEPVRHSDGTVTMLLNPGTAGGMFQYPTFATVDIPAMTHQFQQVHL